MSPDPEGARHNYGGLITPAQADKKKKISVFRVTGLNILGRVGTHFFWKKIYSKHFERRNAFQNA